MRWKEFSQHLIVIGLKFSEFLRFLLKFFILSSFPHSPYSCTALARQPRISTRSPFAQKQCSYRCFVLIQALKTIFRHNRIKTLRGIPNRVPLFLASLPEGGGPRLWVPRSERSRALGVRGERWKEFLSDFVTFRKLKYFFSVIPSGKSMISGYR